MTETQYKNSAGIWTDIASLPYPHLKNAAGKLRRSGEQPESLAAMDARLTSMEATYRLEQGAIVNDPLATEEERAKATAELARLDAEQAAR